jgi:hypothetical protein
LAETAKHTNLQVIGALRRRQIPSEKWTARREKLLPNSVALTLSQKIFTMWAAFHPIAATTETGGG